MPDKSTSRDIHTVREWSDVEAAENPAVTINAGADGADCLTGWIRKAAEKWYCYNATEEFVIFAEVGDNFTGSKLESVQRKPVSAEFRDHMVPGARLPGDTAAGVTEDGTLYGLVPSPANTLDAVSMADGKVLWSAPAEADAGSAARDAGYMLAAGAVVFSQGDAVVAVDAGSGKELWREDVTTAEGSAEKLHLAWLSMTETAVAVKVHGKDKPNGQTKFRVLRSQSG
ncbi:PQQ-binding-like beta-propeller repeat protein [Brevibacterium sp. Marseille-P9724]|uniref:outer membrane protein assembly factor BamB family protein n=1 Tax=Brevibacterium sp. Marseille-P9724 TaxID=2614125 RepID=UPI00125F1605|nr:PQQ-binding-like beta-propeller repeat protein [Brevibacterium sp. Marseille-P9724]